MTATSSATGDHLIPRTRLTIALADRFEHRLTTIIAPAGSGKTTALAQAVQSNALQPLGQDVWLGAGPADAEPATLISGMLAAFGVEASGDVETDSRLLSELVWSRAPTRVTLIVDDAHHLSGPCAEMLARLLVELPANGQLLLSGRSSPPLAIARLRSLRQVLEITREDLALDDDEVRMLVAARGAGDEAELPRHAASADLALRAGPQATSEYLWEEVLGQIEPARLGALVSASVLDEIDDSLAAALSGGTFSAGDLTHGLPMVETHQSGHRRMHALLRGALTTRLSDAARIDALRRAARVEVDRGRLGEACELFARAGDESEAVDAARKLVVLPTLSGRLDTTRSVRRSIAGIAGNGALHQLLDGQCELNLPSETLATRFSEVAAAARDEGDQLIEAVAVFRSIQAANNGDAPLPETSTDRIRSLASQVPYADAVHGYLESLRHQGDGNAESALAALERCGPLGRETLLVMKSERFCDLGRPELVASDLGPEDVASLPAGAEIFISFAMWLRGEASPEEALAIGSSMLPSIRTRGLALTVISFLSVLTHIALAAGESSRARDYATECASRAASIGDVRTTLFAAIALASTASADGDDDEAAALINPDVTGVPFGAWPARPLLVGLPLVYLSGWDAREPLSRCSFGPSLQIAVDAGRALVELREGGSALAASKLAWHEPNVLRAHVLPHHLAELAAAASSRGVATAERLLDDLPAPRAGVAAAAGSPISAVAAWATGRLAKIAPEPEHEILVKALGPIELYRDGELVTDPDWVRRVRVRELLGLMLERGSIPRSEAASLLWPDLDSDRATNNLRVTLSRLQAVLEPDRNTESPRSFMRTEGQTLTIDGVLEVDVADFERILEQGSAVDRAGGPAEAVALYESALQKWRGPYLETFDATWLTVTRMRLDSLARTAMVRLGELDLAKGEPERALKRAAAAQALNPLDERAGRLMGLAMLGMGDRAGALSALGALTSALSEADLEAQPETTRVVERIAGAS